MSIVSIATRPFLLILNTTNIVDEYFSGEEEYTYSEDK